MANGPYQKSSKAFANQRENNFEAIIPGVSQLVAAAVASGQSAALGVGTSLVRLFSTVDCFILVGANPTALVDGTSMFLPGGIVEYFGVTGGQKIAVIAAGASTGSLYVTEGA